MPIPLRLWPTTLNTEVGEGLRVSDLLRLGEAEWDGDKLGQLFGEHLVERVRSIPLSGSVGPDVKVWSTTYRASIGIGEVARLLQPGSQPGLNYGWVWRFGLHQRIALFLWKVAWERLPTCSVLCRRGMSLSPSCPDCGVDESVDHVLFHCVWARGVWSLIGIPGDTWSGRDSFLEEVRNWAGAPQMRGLAIRASCTAYQIWLARNARVFGERRLSLRFVMEQACAQAAEIIQVEPAHRPLIARNIWSSHIASAAPHRVFFTWETPPRVSSRSILMALSWMVAGGEGPDSLLGARVLMWWQQGTVRFLIFLFQGQSCERPGWACLMRGGYSGGARFFWRVTQPR
ncbi:uncharacterized protein LOC103699441 [Phoenix dactylifera]|uniref:Uncharacterized protein LOC103699441 n=1 Tax=Phoenix dactylifera TaxID=42345 RepID=A0A8B7BKK9_PHODC|nr:uncharacterized protein LOC103699441 [Phoenix dactylifera]